MPNYARGTLESRAGYIVAIQVIKADEKLFEKQWNTDDRRGARVGMWQDFQDDKKRSANVKRQRTAVNFKREEKQETKKKYGEWDRESWRRDWK